MNSIQTDVDQKSKNFGMAGKMPNLKKFVATAEKGYDSYGKMKELDGIQKQSTQQLSRSDREKPSLFKEDTTKILSNQRIKIQNQKLEAENCEVDKEKLMIHDDADYVNDYAGKQYDMNRNIHTSLCEDEIKMYGAFNKEPRGYKKLDLLGRGGCACVWLCKEIDSGKLVAIKQFPKCQKNEMNFRSGLSELAFN